MSRKLRLAFLIGGVVTAVVAVASLVLDVKQELSAPAPRQEGPIRELIDQEADAAREGDVDKAVSLYAPGAVVRDAGAGVGWSGLSEIRQRYSDLPKFKKLDHVDVTVTFGEDGEFARAVASTAGEILNNDGSITFISSVSGEIWSFRRIEGDWKIVSFTYDFR